MNDLRIEFDAQIAESGNQLGYVLSPFEIFTLKKLAITTISIDHMKVRISNEVKELLNNFIEQVNAMVMAESDKH